jgi:hypothetical protein
MHNRLKPVDLGRYLKYDLITIIQIPFLLTGHEPVDLNEFFRNHWEYAEQHKIYEMAKASITAKKIVGEGSAMCFAALPMTWISWADSKELKLPKAFRKAYDEYKEKEKTPAPRPNESYRMRQEGEDKMLAQEMMKIIHDFIPELPLAQLVRTPPLKKVFQSTYAPKTFMGWAKDAGVATKSGNISKETKQKCLDAMPKSWNFEWHKEEP